MQPGCRAFAGAKQAALLKEVIMERRRSSGIVVAVVLILLGLWFLAVELAPALAWARGAEGWPLFIVAVGIGLLLVGLATGAPGIAVPACVVGGIGGLLYWQNTTDNWASWAYAWTLIPGFVGIGVMLAGLLGDKPRQNFTGGAWLVLISLILFVIFASFLGGPAVLGQYWRYWPVLLILLGLLSLGQYFFRRR